MLVDSHCHLNFSDFKDDFNKVLARAAEHEVAWMQTICTHMNEFEEIHAIATNHENIYCSVGVHPNNVAEHPLVTEKELLEMAALPKVIGLGETGLDYYYEHSDRASQQESFRRHIRVSQQTGLPIIIHTRDAEEDTISIVREMMQEKKFKALIHCFSGTQALADACLDMGLYLSIPGIITFKKAEELRDVVKQLPLERLLVETDAPYLAPVPKRGKRNEPAFTRHTAEYLAELIEEPYEKVAEVTTRNFFELFDRANQWKG